MKESCYEVKTTTWEQNDQKLQLNFEGEN